MISELFDCHGKQRYGYLLTRSKEHIHLSLGCLGINLLRLFDKVICRIALSGNNHNNIVAFGISIRHYTGDIHNSFGVRDRTSAEFLNNQCHIFYPFPGISIIGDPNHGTDSVNTVKF